MRAASAAPAQQPATPAAPPPIVDKAPAAPAPTRIDHEHRRDQIGVMEGVLAQAVRNGAVRAGRDLAPSVPGTLSLTGQARARGFILEGYGVFFDVEIPSLLKSVAWVMQSQERDQQSAANSLQSIRDLIESIPENSPKRRHYQTALRQLEQQIGGAGPQRISSGTKATDPPALIEVQGNDPDALYAKSVIASCVDAMLDYSKPMDVQPEEWLTVALRGSEGPAMPGELSEVRTVLVRVKGSDLTDFLAGRISRDDVRDKVIVRQF
jgi:hypothetical protein